MYNLRYHIASLVGVFLALSLGLLLGTIVAERGTLDDQRDALINNLEADFKVLSERNRALETENEQCSDFVDDVVPVLVRDTLAGKRVLVLASAGRSDGLSAVEQAIQDAGGTVIPVIVLQRDLSFDSEDLAPVLAELQLGGTDALRSVAASLAAEWAAPAAARPVTDAFIAAGALRVEGLAPDGGVDAVVSIAAWEREPDVAAISIAQALSELGVPGAGAQAVSLDTGVAVAAVDAGLSAVDQMGRPQGAYSLVKVLSGEVTGYFGVGPGAIAPYPRP